MFYLFNSLCIRIYGINYGCLGLILEAVMGIGMAGIGMSVMHDANHGVILKSEGE